MRVAEAAVQVEHTCLSFQRSWGAGWEQRTKRDYMGHVPGFGVHYYVHLLFDHTPKDNLVNKAAVAVVAVG